MSTDSTTGIERLKVVDIFLLPAKALGLFRMNGHLEYCITPTLKSPHCTRVEVFGTKLDADEAIFFWQVVQWRVVVVCFFMQAIRSTISPDLYLLYWQIS